MLAHLWILLDSRNVVLVVVGFWGGVRREWVLLVRSAVLDFVCVERCELLLVTFVLVAAVVVG